MGLIIMAVALVALGILAAMFGADSRDWPRSSEQRYADFGAVWPDALLHGAMRPRQTDPDRLRVAMLLTVLPLLLS